MCVGFVSLYVKSNHLMKRERQAKHEIKLKDGMNWPQPAKGDEDEEEEEEEEKEKNQHPIRNWRTSSQYQEPRANQKHTRVAFALLFYTSFILTRSSLSLTHLLPPFPFTRITGRLLSSSCLLE